MLPILIQEQKEKLSLESKVKEESGNIAEKVEPAKEPPLTTEKKEKESRKIQLEEIESLSQILPEPKLPPLEYSFDDREHILQPSYGHPPIEYAQVWYKSDGLYTGAKSAFAEDEKGVTITNDAEADIIPVEEAQEAFQKVQYAALVGASTGVNFEERRKLSLLFLFNRDLALLLESTMAVTREVNYTYSM